MRLKDRRIIYFCIPFDFPSGGVAVIYKHVEILSRRGFNAFLALPRLPAVDFYNSNPPLIIHNWNMRFEKGDICVIPEGFRNYMEDLKAYSVRKVMFCQNHYLLPFSGDFSIGASEYPVDNIVVSAESIRNFMTEVYGLSNVPVIPCSVDTDVFYGGKKIRQVAFMPRKLKAEAAFIEAAFKRKYREYSHIPWVAIDGQPQAEVARIMRSSEVFLSLSSKDSFGLPPLEAMASGCLVAGFHGDGGREYMTKNNGWWADSSGWLDCVKGLAAAFQLIDEGGTRLEEIKKSMKLTVERYSVESMEEALVNFWKSELRTAF